jgi:hypothetical protein
MRKGLAQSPMECYDLDLYVLCGTDHAYQAHFLSQLLCPGKDPVAGDRTPFSLYSQAVVACLLSRVLTYS